MTVKDIISDKFLNKKVKIVVGHPNNGYFLTGIITDVSNGNGHNNYNRILLNIKDIEVNSDMIEYVKRTDIYLDIDTIIEIVK